MEDSGTDFGKESDTSPRGLVDRGGIVTARGTGEGLVIRLDGRVAPKQLQSALYDFILSRKSFLAGNSVAFEWVSAEAPPEVVEQLRTMLAEEFEVSLRGSFLHRLNAERANPERSKSDRAPSGLQVEVLEEQKSGPQSLGLFGGIEGLEASSGMRQSEMNEFRPVRGGRTVASSAWDDPDARIVYATLRGGQKIETEHSLIVVGDVNSGAELIAGGDIVVLGVLRGVAHAGAYDETGGGRFIFALSLQPTQLRIGMVISRGTQESGGGPEIARVDGNIIMVEPYHAKTALSKMRRF